MLTLGERIRLERKRYGMTQKELADRSHISKTAMNDLEQGRTRDPSLSVATRIARALGLSLDHLVQEEDSHV